MTKRLIYEVESKQGDVGGQYQHLCATKYEQVAAQIGQKSTWDRRQRWETKEKLFVCSAATSLLGILPGACEIHMVLTNRRVFASLAQRKTIPIFKFVKFRNSQNTVFCFPPASKQILLRSQCWLEHVFVVYLISSLNQTYGGHKPGFKRMSRRRNIYFGEAGGQTVFRCLNGNICKKHNNQYIIK